MNHPEPHRSRPAWSETPTEQLHLATVTQALAVVDDPVRRRPRGLLLGLVVLALAGFAAFGVALGTGASYTGQSADPAPSTVGAPATTTEAPETTAPETTTPRTTTPETGVAPDVETGPVAPGRSGVADGAAGPAGPAADRPGAAAPDGPGRAGPTGPRG